MDTRDITDEGSLLQQLRDGHAKAFESLYKKYYGALYLHAYHKIRDREASKDIVHDLFAVIWQKREAIEIKTSLSSYLYTGIRNRILDWIDKEKSRSNYLDSLTDYPEVSQATTDHLLREKQLKEQIENVLSQLPPRLREIFELSRKSHLSHKEISDKLNLSEQSVRSYIKDVLRILRIRLNSMPWMLFMLYFKIFYSFNTPLKPNYPSYTITKDKHHVGASQFKGKISFKKIPGRELY